MKLQAAAPPVILNRAKQCLIEDGWIDVLKPRSGSLLLMHHMNLIVSSDTNYNNILKYKWHTSTNNTYSQIFLHLQFYHNFPRISSFEKLLYFYCPEQIKQFFISPLHLCSQVQVTHIVFVMLHIDIYRWNLELDWINLHSFFPRLFLSPHQTLNSNLNVNSPSFIHILTCHVAIGVS